MAGHGLVHRVTNERDRRSLPCRFQHGSMRFGEITNATDGNFTRERLSQANWMFLNRSYRGDRHQRISGFAGAPRLLAP
jgi:hypothetical protein